MSLPPLAGRVLHDHGFGPWGHYELLLVLPEGVEHVAFVEAREFRTRTPDGEVVPALEARMTLPQRVHEEADRLRSAGVHFRWDWNRLPALVDVETELVAGELRTVRTRVRRA